MLAFKDRHEPCTKDKTLSDQTPGSGRKFLGKKPDLPLVGHDSTSDTATTNWRFGSSQNRSDGMVPSLTLDVFRKGPVVGC